MCLICDITINKYATNLSCNLIASNLIGINNYNLGTAITYLLRAGKKTGNPMAQDINKAIAHLQRELLHIEENKNDK